MSVTLVKHYDPTWPSRFEELRHRFDSVLSGRYCSLEHVGSTSVAGMTAKPIIDVDIVIERQDFESTKDRLAEIGYFHEGDLGIPGRDAFDLSDSGLKESLPAHHTYVCDKYGEALKRHLVFRDFLRQSPEYARRLSNLKWQLAEEHDNDRQSYMDGKVFSIGCRVVSRRTRMSLSSQLAASVMLSVSLFCVAQGQRASDIPFDEREQTQWHVLSGPEAEKGMPVKILSYFPDGVRLSVDGRRGITIKYLSPQRLPAVVTFQFQSEFDPRVNEPATKLFGTGDFRIFIGSKGNSPDNLGAYEGLQLRIFPHLADSQKRHTTGDESHTATSLWIRNIDDKRRTNNDGDPHTGLLSDACQNRSRQKNRHNCGWSRVSLISGGFGLRNREVVTISIVVTREQVKITAGKWHHEYTFGPSELRISQIDALAIGHTNISRGYKTVTLSGVVAESTDR